MPRVTSTSRPNATSATPTLNAFKIPLNDDRQEKAIRLQSRQALQDLQKHKIKAAASPMRKHQPFDGNASRNAGTPQGKGQEDGAPLDDFVAGIPNAAMTPMKRMPILANFEEWMKMATDNKINATNSWNFALIDYFHDMSLLKEGDGVNFQKASCTLDGCVKIYTSRVDSVATETGKLLSGLTEGDGKRDHSENDREADGSAADFEGDEDHRRKQRRRAQRTSEATLAPSFASLHLKKFDLEFSVDQLFKKASADFDEGGARGLLLNNLAIDHHGRLSFDNNDDIDQREENFQSTELPADFDADPPSQCQRSPRSYADPTREDLLSEITNLGSTYFPELDRVDSQFLCPSMREFDIGNPSSLPESLALNSTNHENRNALHESGENDDRDQNLNGFGNLSLDEGADDLLADRNEPVDVAFGEGGEDWALHAKSGSRLDLADERETVWETNDPSRDGSTASEKHSSISLGYHPTQNQYNGMLGFFDNILEKNWAGPEHWRIQKLRDHHSAKPTIPVRRKERNAFEVNFLSAMAQSDAEAMYTFASSSSAISLSRTQMKSSNRNLLPDDKHFNSRDLLGLFLKPRARIGNCGRGKQLSTVRTHSAKAASHPDLKDGLGPLEFARRSMPGDESAKGDYDANFFQDDGLDLARDLPADDEDEFENAREEFSPAPAEIDDSSRSADDATGTGHQNGPFGSHLIVQGRRAKPEYLQYAKSAKKIDVRQLKEELWKGIRPLKSSMPNVAQLDPLPLPSEESLEFTTVMKGLRNSYPKDSIQDISTSYCFICLLHLANENGLVLSNEESLQELRIENTAS